MRKEAHAQGALLVTEKDAARMLSICEKTLYNLRTAGELPCVKIGRAIRYRLEDLKQWIERRRFGGPQVQG